MSSSVVTLIVQLVAGAIGANAAAIVLRELNLGIRRNTIAGAIGGGIGGQILMTVAPSLAPALAVGSGDIDIDALASQAFGCAVGGVVVVAIIALIKSKKVAR